MRERERERFLKPQPSVLGQVRGLHTPRGAVPHPGGGCGLGQNPEAGPRTGCGKALRPELGLGSDPPPGAETASALCGVRSPRATGGGDGAGHRSSTHQTCRSLLALSRLAPLRSNPSPAGPGTNSETGYKPLYTRYKPPTSA